MKRAFDLLVAGLGLVVSAPFLALAALAILVSSGGPVLYRQERVGRGFEHFEILKLRTMTGTGGPGVTVGADRRITPVGRVLRRVKLDELPQLLNVLKGDMSMVGPRPEIPEYVEQFREDYEVILTVRPGITDEASIRYRRESDLLAQADDPEHAYVDAVLPDKIALGRDYVADHGLAGDVSILVRTLWAIVTH